MDTGLCIAVAPDSCRGLGGSNDITSYRELVGRGHAAWWSPVRGPTVSPGWKSKSTTDLDQLAPHVSEASTSIGISVLGVCGLASEFLAELSRRLCSVSKFLGATRRNLEYTPLYFEVGMGDTVLVECAWNEEGFSGHGIRFSHEVPNSSSKVSVRPYLGLREINIDYGAVHVLNIIVTYLTPIEYSHLGFNKSGQSALSSSLAPQLP